VNKFSLWLETINDRVKEEVIKNLHQAKVRIGQYGAIDYRAASDADAILRGVRGYLRIAQGASVDQDIIFNLTRLANSCNHLSHLDLQKKEKIAQIQADIDSIIQKLS